MADRSGIFNKSLNKVSTWLLMQMRYTESGNVSLEKGLTKCYVILLFQILEKYFNRFLERASVRVFK